MPESIDVVTTATLRPELLELTYRSFHKRLLSRYRHCRLIINIDPLPVPDETKLEKILAISHRWFPEVVYRTPESPSFPAAVRWAWSQLESDFCFHLEDDWLLLKHIDPVRVAGYFAKDPRLAEVTLNPSRNKPIVPGLALRPSFFRRSFIESALPHFDDALDPEKQWRRHLATGGVLEGWQFRHYGELGEGKHIKDLGGIWRKARGIGKQSNVDNFWGETNSALAARLVSHCKLALYAALFSIEERIDS